MSRMRGRQIGLFCCLLAALSLTACGGGSRMLREPVDVELTQPLARAADEHLEATLDWVIVKDGPGTWSKNAWWDEYLLRVGNRSGAPVTIESIQVIDSLGTPLAPGIDRKQLVHASKGTARRYKEFDVDVRPGAGTGTLVAVGTGALFVGGAAAAVSIGAGIGSALAGTAVASTPAIVSTVGTAAVIAAPVFLVGSVVKGANNSKVNKEIIRRRTETPFELEAGNAESLNLFFPIAPSPRSVQIVYEANGETRVVEIVTTDALQGLHLADPQSEDAAVAEAGSDEQ